MGRSGNAPCADLPVSETASKAELEHSLALQRRLTDLLFKSLLDAGVSWDAALNALYDEGWMRQGHASARVRIL